LPNSSTGVLKAGKVPPGPKRPFPAAPMPALPASGVFITPDHEREYRAFVDKHPDLEAVEFLLVDPNGVTA
jgi:glutamine synthetase